jgi:hypothetical protein
VVYRRYAGLFFAICIDVTDNELTTLEAVHLFVEILDHYFQNVCELDLVFNFHKVMPGQPAAQPGTSRRRSPAAAAATLGAGPAPGAACCLAPLRRAPKACSPQQAEAANRSGGSRGGRAGGLGAGCGCAWSSCRPALTLARCSALPQVYLILDEFIMGGEMQETSKKVGVAPGRRHLLLGRQLPAGRQ